MSSTATFAPSRAKTLAVFPAREPNAPPSPWRLCSQGASLPPKHFSAYFAYMERSAPRTKAAVKRSFTDFGVSSARRRSRMRSWAQREDHGAPRAASLASAREAKIVRSSARSSSKCTGDLFVGQQDAIFARRAEGFFEPFRALRNARRDLVSLLDLACRLRLIQKLFLRNRL